MKYTVIWFFIFLLSFGLSLKAQHLAVRKISAYPAAEHAPFIRSNAFCTIIDNEIYLFNGFDLIKHDSLGRSNKTSLAGLLNKEDAGKINILYGYSYFFNKDQLIIKNENNLYLFKYAGSGIKFMKRIQIKSPSQENIFADKEHVYLFGTYNVHEKSLNRRMRSGYVKINIETGVEEIHEIPFDYLVLTYFSPNRFIDFGSQQYIVCDPLKYHLRIYNLKNEASDSIIAPDSIFSISPDIEKFQKLFQPRNVSGNATSYFGPMRKFLDQMDRIWTVNFINDTLLFVRLTRNSLNNTGEEAQLFYDHIWSKTPDGWKLAEVKNLEDLHGKAEIQELADVWPMFAPGAKLIFSEGRLKYLFWSSVNDTFPQKTSGFYWPKTGDAKPRLKVAHIW